MLGLGLGTSKGGFIDALAEVTNTKSVLFDQTDDFIQFGDLDVVTDNFTISGWVKPTDASDFGVIMSKYDDNTTYKSDRVFRIVISGSVCICTIKTSSGNNLATSTTTTTLSDGEWFHFAFTNDGSNLKGYINGVLEDTDSTASGSLNSSNQNFLIGAQYVNTVEDNEFGGNIDEVGIWNEALTASEVAQIYHGSQANFDLSQNGGGYTSASNLQAWWRMGDGILDDNNIAGNGLIGDQTNPTLATAITPHLNDDGNFNGNNWSTVAGDTGDWTGHNSSQTSMTLTKNGTDTGDLRLNLQSSINSGMSSDLESNAIYKFVYSVSTTSSLPSFQFRINHGGGTTTNLVAGTDNVIYFKVESASVFIQVRSNTDGQNFTLSNISLEKVNGNAGVMINMPNNAIETDTP
tara:strand:- start:99 stop:1316 length:1218 start_codon:yes stop_codon:yes gene_type:complete